MCTIFPERSALAGYPIEVGSSTGGGLTLAQHADADSEQGKKTLAAIEKGWDTVFLQDNSNCVSSPEKEIACRTLDVLFSVLPVS